ncbi:hypothetical protein A33M_0661 [Rhodovulum sp. PH10]|uniref:hypothetical protein n=1 Tax=Rhodovulum sp. PH10 TaxID=1187851 RepID=UPI00027C2BD6|nr:hypothetical protein [Rhodovulum sp. PH10]EJW10042.1 hypothetical protein A33M_0661 [Rhodovulum sp. PH10]
MLRRSPALLGLALAAALTAAPAAAQSPQQPAAPSTGPADAAPPPARNLDCPPGVSPQEAPTIGRGTTGSAGSGESLSGKLADSNGIVCPPAHPDTGMVEPPPAGGALRVIPPPGTPGGDPTVTPK